MQSQRDKIRSIPKTGIGGPDRQKNSPKEISANKQIILANQFDLVSKHTLHAKRNWFGVETATCTDRNVFANQYLPDIQRRRVSED